MIGEQTQREELGCVTVACKVPAWVSDLLNIIAKSRDAVVNDLLKMCIMFLIETAKLTTEPSPDMKVLLNMIKMDANWSKMFNYCNKDELDVAQVILILQQSDGKKPREGFGLAMFNKPFMGDCTQILSKDIILERVVELVMGPDTYRQLREVGEHMESGSIRETLSRMIDYQLIINRDESDRNEMPTFGNFHDFGKAIEYGNKSKQYKHRTPDSVANSRQQTIQFDDYDREVADYEAEEWEGCHREPVAPEDIEETLGGRPFGCEA